jgi:hypothetical protein
VRIQYINRSQIQYMSVEIRNETAKFHVGEHLFRIFRTVKGSEPCSTEKTLLYKTFKFTQNAYLVYTIAFFYSNVRFTGSNDCACWRYSSTAWHKVSLIYVWL